MTNKATPVKSSVSSEDPKAQQSESEQMSNQLYQVQQENTLLKELSNLKDESYYRLQKIRLMEQQVQQTALMAQSIRQIEVNLQELLGEEEDKDEEPTTDSEEPLV